MSDQLQLYVAAAILLLMMFAVWKTARANPVDTGVLAAKVNELTARIDKVAGEVASAATSEEVEALRGELKASMATISGKVSACASKSDLAQVENAIGKVETALDHVCRQNDRQEAATVRIEQFLMGTPTSRGRKA